MDEQTSWSAEGKARVHNTRPIERVQLLALSECAWAWVPRALAGGARVAAVRPCAREVHGGSLAWWSRGL